MERGGGTYSASSVEISMPGMWEMAVTISAGGKEDEARFSYMVGPGGNMGGMHKMSDAAHHADAFWSQATASKRKLFHARYKTSGGAMPMNRIHSWMLNIKTPSGEPVSGAAITVEGGMPMHGHGLPTSPVATAANMPGNYMVEGIKFTMPGHWVVRFDIQAGSKIDTVEFNVMVQ